MPEMLWLLIAVVLVMGLAYLTTRYVAGNYSPMSPRGKNGKLLSVVEQTYMGRDRQILLVQAGDRYFLLGNTPAGITTLAEFTAEEVEAWRAREKGEEDRTPSFAQSLQEILKQRSRREKDD